MTIKFYNTRPMGFIIILFLFPAPLLQSKILVDANYEDDGRRDGRPRHGERLIIDEFRGKVTILLQLILTRFSGSRDRG